MLNTHLSKEANFWPTVSPPLGILLRNKDQLISVVVSLKMFHMPVAVSTNVDTDRGSFVWLNVRLASVVFSMLLTSAPSPYFRSINAVAVLTGWLRGATSAIELATAVSFDELAACSKFPTRQSTTGATKKANPIKSSVTGRQILIFSGERSAVRKSAIDKTKHTNPAKMYMKLATLRSVSTEEYHAIF